MNTTTQTIAEMIEALRDELIKEYGSDYAFVILCRGKVIAASNQQDGIVRAQS